MYCVLGQMLPTFLGTILRNVGRNATTDTAAHPGTLYSPAAPLQERRTPAPRHPGTQAPIQLKASNANTGGIGKYGDRTAEIMVMQTLRVQGRWAFSGCYKSRPSGRLRMRRTIPPLQPSAFLRLLLRPCSDSAGHVASIFTTEVYRVRQQSSGQPFHVFGQSRCVTSADVT